MSSPCLFSYRFATSPDPIQASTVQTMATARINLTVLGSDQPAYSDQIMVAVPIGPAAGDLSEKTPGVSVNTAKWGMVSLEIKKASELGIVEASDTFAVYTFQCRDPRDYRIDYPLVFGLKVEVNAIPGDFAYLVREHSGTTSDSAQFTWKDCSFTLTKATPHFYLSNLMATQPESPTVPTTEFGNGKSIRLSWESNGTYFQLFRKNEPKPIYAGMATTYTVADGVKADTTFVLVASMAGDGGGDRAGGYEPIYLYDALTVTVADPDLTPKTVTVADALRANGSLHVKELAALNDLLVDGTFKASGQSVLGKVSVVEGLAADRLHVNGDSALVNVAVTGNLQATGKTTFGEAVATGQFRVKSTAEFQGGVTATGGPVAITGNVQGVGSGTYTAHTDGFAIGVVVTPSPVDKHCVTWIAGASGGLTMRATGGTLGSFGRNWKTFYSSSNNQSFVLPVRKGASWTVWLTHASDNEVNAPVSFYWIPLGTAANGKTFEQLSEDSTLAEEMQQWAEANQGQQSESAHGLLQPLVAALEQILEQPERLETKTRVAQALKRLLS